MGLIKNILRRLLLPGDVAVLQKTVILDGRMVIRAGGKTVIIPVKAVAQSPAEAAGRIFALASLLESEGEGVSGEIVGGMLSDPAAVERLINSLKD